MSSIFSGAITALITPFKTNPDGNTVDYQALSKVMEHQAANGIKTVVVAGSTGEASSLSYDEYIDLSREAIALGKQYEIKIVIGVGFNATHVALQAIKDLNNLQPDGLMCTCPCYNKPTQEGMYQHFKLLHDASEHPIMLYSVPSRTGIELEDDTIIKLSQLPNIVAFKDAGNDIERPLRLSKTTDLHLLSGEDSLALAHLALGAVGVVSVMSNIAPKHVIDTIETFQSGHPQEALRKQHESLNLCKALFTESNPIGVKCAASILGLCENILRLPLTTATNDTQDLLKNIITDFVKEDANG